MKCGRISGFLFGLLALLLVPHGSGAEPLTLEITEANCARLVAHQARDDVVYRPDVDVRGRSVVPADADGAPPLALPERYRIRIEVDSADRFGIPADADSYDADIQVGEAEVLEDGRVLLNGQPLQSDEAFELGRLCREQLGAAR